MVPLCVLRESVQFHGVGSVQLHVIDRERENKGCSLARARTGYGWPSCLGTMVETIPFDLTEDKDR